MSAERPEAPTDVRLWGSRTSGPVHLVNAGNPYSQAWCGARPQFRHRVYTGPESDVTCRTCLTRIKAGRPRARGRWAR